MNGMTSDPSVTQDLFSFESAEAAPYPRSPREGADRGR